MRAATIRNKKLVVEEHDDPTPQREEVLVRVISAGLNNADLAQVAGNYPPPAGYPADIPGMEFYGEVVGCGPDADRYKTGDRVMALTGGGAQAELAVVHESVALPVPEALTDEQAGGFCEATFTALDALVTRGELVAGERLLVQGAAGGVGIMAVQLGIGLGANVIASVRNSDHHDAVKALGAEVVTPAEAEELSDLDVVLELVGAPNFPADIESLATRGRVVLIGMGGGAQSQINLGKLLYKMAKVVGATMRGRSIDQKAAVARLVYEVALPMAEHKQLTVPVEAAYSLDNAQAAYDRFAAGKKFGKIVLMMEN